MVGVTYGSGFTLSSHATTFRRLNWDCLQGVHYNSYWCTLCPVFKAVLQSFAALETFQAKPRLKPLKSSRNTVISKSRYQGAERVSLESSVAQIVILSLNSGEYVRVLVGD